MPFVEARLTTPVSDTQEEQLKSGLAEAVAVFGKGESFLMVNIVPESSLWLGGRHLDRGAYVSLSLVGDTPDAGCVSFTSSVCELLDSVLGIPGEQVYITFHPMSGSRWGWNGGTF